MPQQSWDRRGLECVQGFRALAHFHSTHVTVHERDTHKHDRFTHENSRDWIFLEIFAACCVPVVDKHNPPPKQHTNDWEQHTIAAEQVEQSCQHTYCATRFIAYCTGSQMSPRNSKFLLIPDLTKLFKLLRLYSVGWQNDQWLFHWKECGRKRPWPNLM